MSDPDERPDGAKRDPTTPNVYLPTGEYSQMAATFDERATQNQPSQSDAEGAARPTVPNMYGLTSLNAGPAQGSGEVGRQPPPTQQPPPGRAPMPIWVWVAFGISFVLLLTCAVLLAVFYYSSPPQVFTLRVQNAQGGQVYVDDTPSGVPQADGSILVEGLRAGGERVVIVRREGAPDYQTTVAGSFGEVRDLNVPTAVRPEVALPNEIDFNGSMVLVAAGEFVMGADDEMPNEAPAHSLFLPAYYVDRFEVTNGQYSKFCRETGHPLPVDPAALPNYFRGNPTKPVMGVSFDDAVAYAQWAGKRLPTEQEWEKAASWDPATRHKRKWPWGDSEGRGRANVGTGGPANVGDYPGGVSAYGAEDMAGNVVEWVDSVFAPYPGSTYQDADYGKDFRVYRGGSFPYGMTEARTTYRRARDGSYKTSEANASKPSLVGFRCAISADDPRVQSFLRQSVAR